VSCEWQSFAGSADWRRDIKEVRYMHDQNAQIRTLQMTRTTTQLLSGMMSMTLRTNPSIQTTIRRDRMPPRKNKYCQNILLISLILPEPYRAPRHTQHETGNTYIHMLDERARLSQKNTCLSILLKGHQNVVPHFSTSPCCHRPTPFCCTTPTPVFHRL
jgi:hypothetical protein